MELRSPASARLAQARFSGAVTACLTKIRYRWVAVTASEKSKILSTTPAGLPEARGPAGMTAGTQLTEARATASTWLPQARCLWFAAGTWLTERRCRSLGAGAAWVLILALTGLPSMATSDQDYQLINALYQSGRLEPALTKVNFLLKSDGANGSLHYYKGNILAKAGKVQEARVEYEKAIGCKPPSMIASYCIEALRAIEAPSTDGALTTIRSQTLTTEQKLQQEAYTSANNVRQNALMQANAISAQAQAQAAGMSAAGYYDNHRNWIPLYSPAEISRVQQDGNVKAQNALLDGDRSSQAVVLEAQRRAQAMEDSAQNLEYQLNNRFSADNVRLDSNGTNLYIRHYITETNSQIPQRAKQEVGSCQDPLSATSQALSLNSSSAQVGKKGRALTTVTGKVVKPLQSPRDQQSSADAGSTGVIKQDTR